MKKKTLTLLVSIVAIINLMQAQQTGKSTTEKELIFRFYAGNDMFFFPGKGNEKAFRKACDYIEAHRKLIESGQMPIYINGYCGTKGTPEERLERVRIMSNRVKSKFIRAKIAIEGNFVTCNSKDSYNKKMHNVVILRLMGNARQQCELREMDYRESLSECHQSDRYSILARQHRFFL